MYEQEFKITVPGETLRKIFLQRADHHKKRAARALAASKAAKEAASELAEEQGIEEYDLANNNTNAMTKTVQQRVLEDAQFKARHFAMLAAFCLIEERYDLTMQDVATLEVTDGYHSLTPEA